MAITQAFTDAAKGDMISIDTTYMRKLMVQVVGNFSHERWSI